MMEAIVYFSHPHENFVDGRKQLLSIGNTKVVAEKLSQLLSIPTYELIPVVAYPKDYDSVVDIASSEKKKNIKVEYQLFDSFPEKIDKLFLGFPNWWGTYPQIVATFLDQTTLEGTKIFPFVTHEGSGFGNSITDLKAQCPTSIIKEGLSIRGSRADRSETAIKNWIRPCVCEKSQLNNKGEN